MPNDITFKKVKNLISTTLFKLESLLTSLKIYLHAR